MTMPPPASTLADVAAVLDSAPANRRRTLVILICFAIVAIEGFDAAIIGFVAPQITAHFHSTPGQTSAAIGAGMLGLLIGYLAGGIWSDKRGRRPALAAGTALFGLACIGCAFSAALPQLIGWRLATGIGIGIAMPPIGALLAEVLPSGRRASTLTAVFCGFLLGSALAGLLTGLLIERIGWEGLFVLGGVAPLLCLPAVLARVPESPMYLAHRGAESARVRQALARLGIAVDAATQFLAPRTQTGQANGSVRGLFSPALIRTTVLLWAIMFLILGSFYVIASWLPTLIREGGASVAAASRTAALFQSGGLAGAVVAALAIRRVPPLRYVGAAWLLGAALPLWIAAPAATPVYAVLVFCAGFLVSGPIVVVNAVMAMAYPTPVRSIGAGWASSAGRLGSFAGAGSVGWLVQHGLALHQLIAGMAVTVLASALIVLFLSRSMRASGG
ncbi:MFS transporter [Cupriavidus lacunae]|nr:MFS transporter [Cupriavidus lacunae]